MGYENLIALSNWATIQFSDSFSNRFDAPVSGFGYLYTRFPGSNSYIGIQDGTDNLHVLLNGEITPLPVGSVADILTAMAVSNNGILNLSGDSVSSGIIPSIFSPGSGIISDVDANQTGEAEWTVESDSEKYILTIKASTADGSVFQLTLKREADKTDTQWTLSNSDDTPINGVKASLISQTQTQAEYILTFTENLALDNVSDEIDTLTITAGSTLLFEILFK